MGTSLELRVKARDSAAARWAESCVLAEIDRLSSIFSGYDATTEFSRWQSTPAGPVPVSAELFEVLRACDRWGVVSGGAFDPRVEVLTRLWSRCAREGRTPTGREIDAAMSLMSQPAWRLDPVARTAERLSTAPLTLNAIAKGYIVGRACEAALVPSRGVLGIVLNVGGDMRIAGAVSQRVGVASPLDRSESSEPVAWLEVEDRAIATSGGSLRGFRINGRWYSHIFDPRTGAPAGAVASATVVAPRSVDADALATILNVLPPEEGLRLARTVPGVECLILTPDGRSLKSEGWGRYERPRPTPAAVARAGGDADAKASTDDSSWSRGFELVVEFDINKPEGGPGPYRRPYVAVWIENEKGFPVRNLLLWVSQGGAGPFQWLPEMRRWYRADQARKTVDKTEMVLTISRPTRPPGTYSVAWDGKDDRGKPVPDGQYTVFIDAAREHGTYQSLRKPVTLSGRPFVEELKGNVEIKSAIIRYRRKPAAK